MPLRPSRIFIAGATGFIGRLLKKSFQETGDAPLVVGVSRRGGPGVASCDLHQLKDVQRALKRARPDIVYHCAGATAVESFEKLFDAHVTTTAMLLEAVRLQGPPFPRVVVVGSSAEYGEPRGTGRKISESTSCRPTSAYGISKHLQTQLALSYARWGVPLLIARLFNVVDDGLPPGLAIPSFLRKIRRAKATGARHVMVGSLDAVRDFVTGKDAAAALVALGRRGRAGEVYNVCSGRGLVMRRVWETLCDALGARVAAHEQGLGSTRSRVNWSVGSPIKIRRATGWAPQENPLRRIRELGS